LPDQTTARRAQGARALGKAGHRSGDETAQAATFDIAAWTRRTRERQGIPPKITDPAVLARVVILALGPGPDGAKPARSDG
jgi:hypothetical protein